MTRVKALLAACVAVLACGLVPAAASADGVSVSEATGQSDGLWHLDIEISFQGNGMGANAANIGAGTVRVTLPGADPSAPPAFDMTRPVDPYGYSCQMAQGQYGIQGYECSNPGQTNGASTTFPTDVTLHLISSVCYDVPPDSSPQPAVADVWSAGGESGTPDASFKLSLAGACPATGPDDQPLAPPPVKTCTVPKVRGLALVTATSMLGKAGCRLGKVKRVFSPKVKKGRVIAQAPAAGRKVKNGTKVNLTVSKGPKRG